MNRIAFLATVGALMVLSGCNSTTPSKGKWYSLFDGRSLDGWKPSENKSTFTVKDGMIIAHGARSHLFYVGPVNNADFKNFELKADIMTLPNSNSGIYFHTEYQETDWPNKGFEAQINNTHSDWKKTGSLYNVVDVNIADPATARARKDIVDFKVPLARDNKWFTEYIKVEGKHVIIKVDDKVAVDWTESADWKGAPSMPGRKLSSGTFALQGHDPGSTTYFKNVFVRPLP
jgi:hypothetical protein